MSLKQINLTENENIHYLGRHGKIERVYPLFGTGSGIEIEIKARELWIEVQSDYEIYEPWISVLLDKAKYSRQMIEKGKTWILIFRNFDKTIKHTVKIVKDTQAMSGDLKCYLRICNIKFDGELCIPRKKQLKIEFIGDSITSGEGAVGAKTNMEWLPFVFSGVDNYATMLADELNADYRIVSQSGWGVLSSWDGNPSNNIPDYYEYISGFSNGEENQKDGAKDKYNFASWIADYVIVNLGTNDFSAFLQPALYTDKKGNLFDQKMENGIMEIKSANRLKQAIFDFLIKIRKNNPNAKIVWAYGMLGRELADFLKKTIEQFKKDKGDSRIYFLLLEAATNETLGSREHPGYLCHLSAKNKLIDFLKTIQEKDL